MIGEGGMGVVYMAEQTQPVTPPRGHQGDQAGDGLARDSGAFRGRAAGPGDDGSSQHRADLRRGNDGEWCQVSRVRCQ